MSQVHPSVARPPLATRPMLNNISSTSDAKRAWNHEGKCESPETVEVVYMQHEEEAMVIKALENACRLVECGWSECGAELGSWELLRKHVEKVHCHPLSQTTSGRASSSRPYRCRYAACLNRVFSDPTLLLEHVVTGHLELLKFRCPFACKQPSAAKLQSLVQHLSSIHRKTVMKLPSAQIRPSSPRHIPLPDLPIHYPTFLISSPRVKPCATFDPSKPKLKLTPPSEQDMWDDFMDMDDVETKTEFAKLTFPDKGQVVSEVRPSPRGHAVFDGIQMPARGLKGHGPMDETMGFETWKRRFEAEEATSRSEKNNAKKPRKS